MTARNLAGLSVLVTRPQDQQASMVESLSSAGAAALSLPCLQINPVNNPVAAQTQLQQTDTADVVVFTSTNAVHHAHKLVGMPWFDPLPLILATGPATAEQLLRYKMPVAELPQKPYNSEALLNLPTLRQKSLQKVAIVKGEGGREHLAQSLSKQGISVDLISVYKRSRPNYSRSTIDSLFLNSPPDIVTITSNEALKNLVTIAGTTHQTLLLNLPLIVNSERCATLAKQLGFQSQVIVAPLPGDVGQLEAVKQWNRSYRSKL